MKNYLKKIKMGSLVFSLLCLAFGICLIACPNVAKLTFVCIFGGLICLYGIIQMINYFVYGYEPFGFVYGGLNFTFGILIMSCSKVLASPAVFGMIFGFVFVFNAILKIQMSFDYHRYGSKTWWVEMLFGLIMLVLGIVVLCNPFANEKYLLIFLGVSLIVESVAQIINTIVITYKVSKVKHTIRDMFKKVDDDKNIIDITEEK